MSISFLPPGIRRKFALVVVTSVDTGRISLAERHAPFLPIVPTSLLGGFVEMLELITCRIRKPPQISTSNNRLEAFFQLRAAKQINLAD